MLGLWGMGTTFKLCWRLQALRCGSGRPCRPTGSGTTAARRSTTMRRRAGRRCGRGCPRGGAPPPRQPTRAPPGLATACAPPAGAARRMGGQSERRPGAGRQTLRLAPAVALGLTCAEAAGRPHRMSTRTCAGQQAPQGRPALRLRMRTASRQRSMAAGAGGLALAKRRGHGLACNASRQEADCAGRWAPAATCCLRPALACAGRRPEMALDARTCEKTRTRRPHHPLMHMLWQRVQCEDSASALCRRAWVPLQHPLSYVRFAGGLCARDSVLASVSQCLVLSACRDVPG